MAYGEYRNAGQCPGKCLYQLSKIGVPLHIVETVIFEGGGTITYCGSLFALYEWLDDVPIFKFAPEFQCYEELQTKYCK